MNNAKTMGGRRLFLLFDVVDLLRGHNPNGLSQEAIARVARKCALDPARSPVVGPEETDALLDAAGFLHTNAGTLIAQRFTLPQPLCPLVARLVDLIKAGSITEEDIREHGRPVEALTGP